MVHYFAPRLGLNCVANLLFANRTIQDAVAKLDLSVANAKYQSSPSDLNAVLRVRDMVGFYKARDIDLTYLQNFPPAWQCADANYNGAGANGGFANGNNNDGRPGPPPFGSPTPSFDGTPPPGGGAPGPGGPGAAQRTRFRATRWLQGGWSSSRGVCPMNGHIAASIFPAAAELCDFIYLPEDSHEHSRLRKVNGMRGGKGCWNDPWVLDQPPDFQVQQAPDGSYSQETDAIWLSRGYAFVNLRNPMFSRTFLDIVNDAVVKEGAQPLRVFPARHQGIEELRAHHRAQMQERSNRVYSRMPPVFL